ncbi:MAG TPA: peptidoglycan-binding domain-containing protein [Streptosporangiaceae bacterium]
MKRIRPLLAAAAAALAVASGIAVLPALTSATPASAAVSCTGTSLVADRGGLFEVRVPTVGNGTGNDNCQLGLGNDNVAVGRLQIALNQCNSRAFSPPLAVDNNYGTKTQTAVRKVQAYWGVPVDGIYGPTTRHAMAWPVAGSNGGVCTFVG